MIYQIGNTLIPFNSITTVSYDFEKNLMKIATSSTTTTVQMDFNEYLKHERKIRKMTSGFIPIKSGEEKHYIPKSKITRMVVNEKELEVKIYTKEYTGIVTFENTDSFGDFMDCFLC